MAFENTSIAEQFANIGQQESSTMPEQTSSQDLGSNQLDFSTAESPFGDLNGINVDQIQKDNQNTFGNNPASGSGGPPGITTVQTTQPDVTTPAKVKNNYDERKAKALNFINNFGQVVEHSYNIEHAYGSYEFDQYKSNVDRYGGYNQETFNKLGFNPIIDNESYFNANTTRWQDFKRMAGQLMPLVGSSFMSTYNSVGNLFKGESVIDPDEIASEKQEKAMNIGMSSKGGVRGFANNLVLNSAYAIGIGLNVLAEETAIWGLGALTSEIGGLEAAGIAQEAVEGQQAKQFESLFSHLKNTFRGKEVGQMTSGGLAMLKTIAKAEDGREFWTGIKSGAKVFGKGAAGFFNPFRQTTEALRGIEKGTDVYRNLSNFAKVSKTFGSFYRDMRENWASVSEAQLEGGGVYTDIVNSNIKFYQETHDGKLPDEHELNKIYRDAEAGGRWTTLGNIPMIFLSNRVVFDGLFKFKPIKGLTDIAESAFGTAGARKLAFDFTKKGFTEETKNLFSTTWKALKNPKVYAGVFLNFTKHNFMEGIQESSQDLLSGTVKNYYEGIYKNHTLGGYDYLKSSMKASADENVFSHQGFETFLSGFLMGSVVKGVETSTKFLGQGTVDLFSKTFTPEKYAEYKQKKADIKARAVEALNEMVSDPEKFFSRSKESIVNQINNNNNMSQAKLNNDDKSFYDAKDDKTFDHIFTALNNGTFDKVLDAFHQLGKLSEKELADYFGLSEGSKAKDKLSEYVGRAKEIQERYEFFQDKYPNPFNPAKFVKGSYLTQAQDAFKFINNKINASQFLNNINVSIDPSFNKDQIEELAHKNAKIAIELYNNSDHIKEFIAHKAFEDAKKVAIASEYGFNRAIERMAGVFEDLASDSPIKKANALDFSLLQNENSIRNEISLLKNEIKGLTEGGTADQVRLAKQKTLKLEALTEYLGNLKEYNKNKKVVSTNQYGETIIEPNGELLDPLKNSFNKYLKAVAKIYDENYVFNEKIDNAFSKIVDYYNLNDDAKKYSDIVNRMTDPGVLLRYASVINDTLTNMYDNRKNIIGDSLTNFIGVHEQNAMINAIGSLGAVMNPEDLINLVREGKMPTSFFDLRTNQVIDEKDPRYQRLVDIVETFSNLKKDDFAEAEKNKTTTEEKPEEKTEEKTEEKPVTPSVVTKPQTTPATEGMDAELIDKLRKAYDSWLLTHEGSDTTFDDYVKNFGSAQRIKEEYEREKAKKNAPKTTEVAKYTDAKSLDEKVGWIKANTRINRDAFKSDEEFVNYFEKQRNSILDDIKAGKSKEDILFANGSRNFENEVDQRYSDFLKENGIEESATPEPTIISSEQIAKEKAQKIIDGVDSISNLPDPKLSNNSEATIKLLEMISNLEVKSKDVLEMVENKRKELLKNLEPSDISKGDFITFTDGRKGWVTSTTRVGSFQVKIAGSEKAQYEIMQIADLRKNIYMIERGKTFNTEETEEKPVVLSAEDKEAAEASKNTMDSFTDDAARIKQLNDEILNSTSTDNTDNINNLLDNLGCNNTSK